MALDLSGFTTPASTFEGLDNLTHTMQRKEALRQRAIQEAESEKAASTKFLANYLSDKDKYTGTNYDPIRYELYGRALNQALELTKNGVNISEILTTIDPLVKRAGQYTLNAQQYAANKKMNRDAVKGRLGDNVNMENWEKAYDKKAWEGKEPSEVDPNGNYADAALNGEDVYNDSAFKFNANKDTKSQAGGIISHKNSKGGTERQRVKIALPNWAELKKDKDGDIIEISPKYQIANDGGVDIIHKWEKDKGVEDGPIKLYDKQLFDNMPIEEKAWIVQETKKYANALGVKPDIPQMENFARALAWRKKDAVLNKNYEHDNVVVDNPERRINLTVNTGGSKADQKAAMTRNDLFAALDETPVLENGLIDITPLTGGIVYLTNSRGKRISQPSLQFNPSDKTVTFTDPQDDVSETVSLSKFKSMAKSNNSASDLDYLENLRNYKRNSNLKEQPKVEDDPNDYLKTGTKSFFKKVISGDWRGTKVEKKQGTNKWDKYKKN